MSLLERYINQFNNSNPKVYINTSFGQYNHHTIEVVGKLEGYKFMYADIKSIIALYAAISSEELRVIFFSFTSNRICTRKHLLMPYDSYYAKRYL